MKKFLIDLGVGRSTDCGRRPTPELITWDYREQIDLSHLRQTLSTLTGGRLHLTEVDTGDDQYAIVIAARPVAATEATYLYDRHRYGPDDPSPAASQPRVWRTGDPEPDYGTRVSFGGSIWTRVRTLAWVVETTIGSGALGIEWWRLLEAAGGELHEAAAAERHGRHWTSDDCEVGDCDCVRDVRDILREVSA